MKKRNKKAALELSIGTIVVIVLAVSMLILGIVLVRQILCGAIGLTGDINEKVKGEINRLFGSTGGEIVCIGSGDAAKMIPGKTNNVFCTISAEETEEYELTISEIGTDSRTLTEQEIRGWLVTDSWRGRIFPGDENPRKTITVKVPDRAPEATVFFFVEMTRGAEKELIYSQRLDYEISRTGVVTNAIC